MGIVNRSEFEPGNFEGEEHGATISLILDRSEPGQGPRLHRHAYDETWVVNSGELIFELDGVEYPAGPGDVLVAPAGVPHKFTNQGPGRSDLVCIHASPRIAGEWLE